MKTKGPHTPEHKEEEEKAKKETKAAMPPALKEALDKKKKEEDDKKKQRLLKKKLLLRNQKQKKPQKQKPLKASDLDDVETDEEVNLAVADEEVSTIETTRAALVDFVQSRLQTK